MGMFSALSNAVTGVFTTVSVVTNQMAHTIQTGSSALNVLDKTVEQMREKQLANHEYEMEDFYERLHTERVKAVSEREVETERLLQSNATLAKKYVEVDSRFQSVRDRVRSRLESEKKAELNNS